MSREFPCPRRRNRGLKDDQQADGRDAGADESGVGVRMEESQRITGQRASEKLSSDSRLDLSMFSGGIYLEVDFRPTLIEMW